MIEANPGQLRSIPVTEIQVGDIVARPAMGEAYYTAEDGAVRPAMGFTIECRIFVTLSIDGDSITMRREDGSTATYQGFLSQPAVLKLEA